jgi:hypothetical protein
MLVNCGHINDATSLAHLSCETGSKWYLGSFRFDYEYEIRQAKRMLYAYAIAYWREKVVAVAHLSTKLWRNLVVLTTTFQKNKESWLFFVFQK